METIDGEKRKSDRPGLVIAVLAITHAVFYFASNFHVPVDLDELFLLGYALVLADSGLVVFLGIKLLNRLRTE